MLKLVWEKVSRRKSDIKCRSKKRNSVSSTQSSRTPKKPKSNDPRAHYKTIAPKKPATKAPSKKQLAVPSGKKPGKRSKVCSTPRVQSVHAFENEATLELADREYNELIRSWGGGQYWLRGRQSKIRALQRIKRCRCAISLCPCTVCVCVCV